jgi:branched-chain amino acid transport system permease protein
MRAAALVLVLIASLAAVPLLAGAGTIYFITLILVWGIFAISFDLVFGLTGLLSFGHAAFLGTGAFVYAFIMLAMPDQFLLAILGAIAAAGLLAFLSGALALRLSGIYLSLTTLAIGELVFYAASSPMRALTGGEDGLAGVPRPTLLGHNFSDDTSFYFLVLFVFTLIVTAVAILRESPFGKVLNGIRLNEIRSEQVGFNVRLFKIIIFVISGALSGLAGALLASLIMYVNPQSLHWTTSGDVVIMTLLGGRGTLLGPVIGVAAYEVLKEVASAYTVHWYGILGIIIIFMTIYMPTGIRGALDVPIRWFKGQRR